MISPAIRTLILFIIVGFLTAPVSNVGATEDGRLVLFSPKISPDGTRVAFSHEGDIWIANIDSGECTRLTDHVAHETRPVWFPDSNRVAFYSNRDSSGDIYSIPVSGGIPERHTWHGGDVPLDVSPDGEHILFRSWRRMYSIDLYEVDTHGGLERPITRDEMYNREARYSADGESIAVCRGGMSWVRRHYNGSNSTGIYVMNRDGSDPHWIDNDYDGLDYWPTWSPDDEYIYFVSDRDLGCENLFRIPSEGGSAERLTRFNDRPVRYPSVSDTGRICFEQDFRLWVMDGPESRPREVRLQIADEPKYSQEIRTDISGSITEFQLSPDGSLMALIARGELYISQHPNPDDTAPMGDTRFWESVRITNNASRERFVTWHPDGDRVALVSDKEGNQEIFEIDLRNNEWTRLTRTPEDEAGPDYSPDGNFLSYLRGNRELVVRNLESEDDRTVVDALLVYFPYWGNFFWSPDSQWLAYTLNDARYSGDIYILPISEDGSGDESVNITLHHDSEELMGWSDDGENIYFVSNRRAVIGLESYGSWGGDTGIYNVPLRRVPPPRSDVLEFSEIEEEESEEESSEEETEESEENGDEAEAEEEEERSVIHFDRIDERERLISPTRGTGWSAALSPDGTTFVYVSNALGSNSIWSVPFEGGSATRLTDCGTCNYLQWTSDSNGFYYLDGRTVKYSSKSGSVMNVPTRGRLTVDLAAERLQMITETGRVLRNNFYDPDMHGIDWEAHVEYYTPLVVETTDSEDFELLMDMLFGELDASHLGFRGGSSREGTDFERAWLGMDFDPNTTGPGLLITRVWPRGPADYEEIEIEAGEWVLKINGTDVSTSNNYHALLDDERDRTTVLEVASDRDGTDSREVVLGAGWGFDGSPLPLYDGAYYLDWVEEKRETVHAESDSRIGYIHLPNMMGTPLEQFTRELFSENMDREALIIDIRWNTGGNIHEALLDILSRPQFGWNQNRDMPQRIEQPTRRFDRPIVVLINERSFSDAEIFPAGIRALDLATLIGETTAGGVIGTVNIGLVDGVRSIRVPRVGWFTLEGENMENYGVEPDIRVVNELAHIREGIDDQLNAAIEFLLNEID